MLGPAQANQTRPVGIVGQHQAPVRGLMQHLTARTVAKRTVRHGATDSNKHPFDAPGIGRCNIFGHPLLAQKMPRHFNDNVLGLNGRITLKPGAPDRRAGSSGEDLQHVEADVVAGALVAASRVA